MDVRLASKSGFCHGVENAIDQAAHVLEEGRPGAIYSLGEVIHNRQVVDRLAAGGLKVLERPEDASAGDTVLIRSHGAPPEVIETLRRRGAHIVDATCVLVTRAQDIVRELDREGYQLVVIGDENHPEVRGVVGYGHNVICVDSPEQLDRLPPGGKLGIISQTTHSPERFGEMVGKIAARGYAELKVINTLCLETRRRQAAAVELARQVEVMFVLGGRQSANTRQLARLCENAGVSTYHLESWDDFRPAMIDGAAVAGVTAGASTPEWIIHEFVDRLREV
ncbi:MAG: 4-hydroxy-3-methylbut-2-enyl diphosphate reductase [Planctomycetota bacterium]